MTPQSGNLELGNKLDIQQREWRVQRVGWVVLLLTITLALLGLFGSGPFSNARAGDPAGPLAVDYRRFVRQDAPSTLTFEIGPGQVTNGSVEVWLDSDFLHGVDVSKITPAPTEVRVDDDRLIYQFAAEDFTSPVQVKFALVPQEVGIVSVDVGLVGGPELSFRQVSYP